MSCRSRWNVREPTFVNVCKTQRIFAIGLEDSFGESSFLSAFISSDGDSKQWLLAPISAFSATFSPQHTRTTSQHCNKLFVVRFTVAKNCASLPNLSLRQKNYSQSSHSKWKLHNSGIQSNLGLKSGIGAGQVLLRKKLLQWSKARSSLCVFCKNTNLTFTAVMDHLSYNTALARYCGHCKKRRK